MTDQDDTHFVSNEDLLGRYVLGALDDVERARLDGHLATCPACAQTVHQERLIAAGVKRLGRDELRRSLRTRLVPPQRDLRWPRILAAAGLIATLTGIGIYYLRFNGVPSVPEIAERPPAPVHGNESPSLPQPALAPSADQFRQEPMRSAPGSNALTDAKTKSSEAPSSQRSITDAETRSPSEAVRVTQAPVHKELARKLTEETPAAFWAEGNVEGPEGVRGGAAERRSFSGSRSDLPVLKREQSVNQAAAAKDASTQPPPQFVLRQASSGALPVLRQKALKAAAQMTVQTKVERKGEVTTMTLFLDSLLDEGALRGARVQTLGDDSLVVTLGQKRISYKLPPGTTAQVQTKK